jgi:hypothetical protein
MSTLKVLKEYLVGDGGYLLNEVNNGKTVMLSGVWGSGKTHFWQNDIRPDLLEQEQKNIYISLYGKESIGELKFEVLREAYNLEVKEDFISKTASMISSIAPSLGEKSLVDGYDKLNKKAKEKKSEEILKSGSIICLDDFERKSKNIDLNDLFGYISQLALDYHCKVVIILNSDVFEGEEANVFKTVKEKTVDKFFYFEPTRRELFDSIYDRKDNKYEDLDTYGEDIFNAINEIEELNARIYIQVLDNCLEWIEKGYELNLNICKPLVLSSIFFVKHHYSFYIDNLKSADKVYDMYHAFNENIELAKNIRDIFPQYASGNTMTKDDIIHSLKVDVTKKKKDNNDNENAEIYYASGYKLLEDNKYMLRDFYIYKYLLKIDDAIDAELFNDINMFIKTGILSRKETDI